MPDPQAFSIANFTSNGVYTNQYHFGSDIVINKSHYSYPWNGLLTPVTDLASGVLFAKDQLVSRTQEGASIQFKVSKTPPFNIAYHNYIQTFITKQQKAGIELYSKKFSHKIIYNKQNLGQPSDGFNEIIKSFSIPVIIIQADIFSLSIFEYVPITYKLGVKWRVNQVNISFNNISSFVKNVLAKIMPFLSVDISLNDINNLFFNFLNFRTAKITDSTLIDILRAIFMEMFVKAIQYLGIPNMHEGIIVITGEYPALIKNDASVLLSLIDGLVLRGLWGLSIDDSFGAVDALLLQKHRKLNSSQLTSLFLPNFNIFYSPLEPVDVPVLNLGGIKTKKFFGVSNNIVRFVNNQHYNRAFSSSGKLNYDINLPNALNVQSVIIDTRPRPIEYGPDALNNKANVGVAMYKLIHTENEF